jgi:hypothetical protein
MTYQEVLWAGKKVWVVGILSKSGKLHRVYRKYVGKQGVVLKEAKNNMLLVKFENKFRITHTRAIPAGCLSLCDDVTPVGTVSI